MNLKDKRPGDANRLKISKVKWLIVLLLVVLIKLFSLNKYWVENYYSNGLYPAIAWIFRMMFGWIPLSLGDILYVAAAVWLGWKFAGFTRRLVKKQQTSRRFKYSLLQGLFYLLIIYIVFNLFWGLNYNRLGSRYQLDIKASKYDSVELKAFVALLATKVNDAKLAWIASGETYPDNSTLFKRSKLIYDLAEKKLPYLGFQTNSIKPSLFSTIGNYLGFTGYYNPFTGEAQVNTSAPGFLLPFTTAHEMAHQAGYAKENEASFVAYLAISQTTDQLFLYSTYLDMFIFANRELLFFNSAEAKKMSDQLIPEVRKDIEEWRQFSLKYKNPVEPVFRWLYGKFLKINDQPQGMLTYNEVIGNLIDYYKKYGKI